MARRLQRKADGAPGSEARRARREHGARTREGILAAAETRFARLGFEATRLEDVGADAGVGRSGVLYHFGGKRELYEAVLEDVFGTLLRELRRVMAGPGSLAERIEPLIGVLIDYAGARPGVAQIALREALSPNSELRRVVRRQADPFLGFVSALLEEGSRTGALHPITIDAIHFVSVVSGAVTFYVAAIPSLLHGSYEALSPANLEAHKRDVVAIAQRLLGVDSGPHRTRSPRR